MGEAAFAAIVRRHGAMVLRVCRGVLRDADDADDAFQATFLILARKAGSIRQGRSIASWLYGVARRVALRARQRRTRRLTKGKVSRMSQSEELATRTVRAEIDLLNADGRLWDGMYGQASIVLDKHPDAITIPAPALVKPEGTNRAACFRVVDGHAVRTPITLGWYDSQQVEVLDGLKPGDIVIVEFADHIKDGQAIEEQK